MRLTTGLAAPRFNLKDIYGRMIDLDSYVGKLLLLGFFRHAGCPFCNLRVHTLQKKHQEYKAQGIEMIFFFESKESVLLRSTFHMEVSPIPIIADPTKIQYDAYGLEESGWKSTRSHLTSFVQTTIKAKRANIPVHLMASGESFSRLPAEFLLDRKLNVRKMHYSEGLNDRLDLIEIEKFIQKNGEV